MRLALALSLALFACGGGAKSAATTPAAPEGEAATATEPAPEAEAAPAEEAEPAAAPAPAEPAASAPVPAAAPPATLRGAQKKPASKTADPCAGGE